MNKKTIKIYFKYVYKERNKMLLEIYKKMIGYNFYNMKKRYI